MMSVVMERRTPIVELTYKQLKMEIDKDYLKMGARVRELRKRGTRYAGLRGNALIFRTFSADYGENGIIYEQEVKLLDLAEKLKAVDTPLRDRARDALMNGDVGLRCTCSAYTYWGFGYILYHRKAAAPGRILWPAGGGGRAPVTQRPKYYGRGSRRNRNWQLRGIMCKHLGLIMEVVGAHWNSLVRDLKNQGYE